MISFTSFAVIAVLAGCRFRCGAAQYDNCTNGTVADIGNGRCDPALNIPSCGYDGGDCCPCTCSDGPTYSCTVDDLDCLYPGCDDPSAVPEETSCEDDLIGDGWCDSSNNNIGCSWDGGDVSCGCFHS